MNYDIKEIVKNKNPCTFQNFRKGNMWYKTACGFEFPVSVDPDEIGDASARGALFCAADCENDRFTLLQ